MEVCIINDLTQLLASCITRVLKLQSNEQEQL